MNYANTNGGGTGHSNVRHVNRVDDIIVFSKLTEDEIKSIASLMLSNLSERMLSLGTELKVTDAALTAIAKEGFDDTFGARPLRRAITSYIEDPLSEKILSGELKGKSLVLCDYRDTGFVFTAE